MLHVLNGDALRPGLQRAGLPGEVVAFADMLSEGPVPGALRREEDWDARALELERRYDIPAHEYVEKARAQLEGFAAATKHDEVVLWFEQELFCLVNLAFVLHRLQASPPRRLSLVFPEEPLGQQQWSTLPRLFEQRRDALGLLDHGARLWEAYCSPDPLPLPALAGATNDFPFWERGLLAHLERFPSTRNGLGVPEQILLDVLEEQLQFGELFQRFAEDARSKPFGYGDTGVAALVRDLAAGPKPLVELEDAGGRALHMDQVTAWLCDRTSLGEEVRSARKDNVHERGADRWLGGARVQGQGPVWRWDARASRLSQS